MNRHTKRLAVCGMSAALGVVLMLLGAALGLGIYMAPMLAGWFLMPVGKVYGRKYQLMLWIAISLLSLLFVPEPEENLMFACLFGWYPILRSRLQHLPKVPRTLLKVALFNVIIIAVETLLLRFLAPEAIGTGLAAALLLVGNVTFLLYDLATPIFEEKTAGLWKKLL